MCKKDLAMVNLTSKSTTPRSFPELINITKQENWCVQLGCTTCGAMSFRKALHQIPREEILSGLRNLTQDFLIKNQDMFSLIISEISFFGVGGELLGPLDGTPAGYQLKSNIDNQNRRTEKRLAYEASQTPESIAMRRLKKKNEAILVTAPHRERKLASQEIIRSVSKQLEEISTGDILRVLASKDFGISQQTIAGLLYKRLAAHYKREPIDNNDLNTLSLLAFNYAGYWKKLLDHINNLSQKNQ